jgi:hypothetical protein
MLDTLAVLESEFNKRKAGITSDYRGRASDFGLDPELVAPVGSRRTQPGKPAPGNRKPVRF